MISSICLNPLYRLHFPAVICIAFEVEPAGFKLNNAFQHFHFIKVRIATSQLSVLWRLKMRTPTKVEQLPDFHFPSHCLHWYTWLSILERSLFTSQTKHLYHKVSVSVSQCFTNCRSLRFLRITIKYVFLYGFILITLVSFINRRTELTSLTCYSFNINN